MAKSLRIINRFDGVERHMFLEIDGEEFPYFTAAEGWNVAVSRAGLPGVTLTIVAESVQVDHSINDPLARQQPPEEREPDIRESGWRTT